MHLLNYDFSRLLIKIAYIIMLNKYSDYDSEWRVRSGEWGVGSREWGVGSGEWGVGSGEWGVGSGESLEWRVMSGEWRVQYFNSSGCTLAA